MEDIIKNITNQNDFKIKSDVFFVKIMSSFLAYGKFPDIAKFWQGNDAVYCLWGDNLTISGIADKSFVDFLKPKSVLCSLKNSDILNLSLLQSGQVMHKSLTGTFKQFENLYSDDIKSMFKILNECEMIEDFESFKLECSHKLRHALGTYTLINEKAVALSLYSFEKYAIINAVGTAKDYRKQGFGKTVLENLENKLSGRQIYLLKEKDKNDEFYKKQNYKAIDQWCIGELR